jgi:hypothetical protein
MNVHGGGGVPEAQSASLVRDRHSLTQVMLLNHVIHAEHEGEQLNEAWGNARPLRRVTFDTPTPL